MYKFTLIFGVCLFNINCKLMIVKKIFIFNINIYI